MIMWIINQWSLFLWAIIFLAVVISIWRTLGLEFALPFAAVGSVLLSFFAGKKIQRDEYKKEVQDIEENRKREYDKIDDRNTSASDAADRLRNGDF